jgi:hypothetical protein
MDVHHWLEIDAIIQNSFFVPNTQKEMWKEAFHMFKSGNSFYATVYMLPILVFPIFSVREF